MLAILAAYGMLWLLRRLPGHVGAVEQDPAAAWRHAAPDDSEQRGFPGPVRPAQPEQAAGRQRYRDVVQHGQPAVLLADAVALEEHLGLGLPRRGPVTTGS